MPSVRIDLYPQRLGYAAIFRFRSHRYALGDTLQVPTIDGRIEYKIPEGTQTGTTFRLRGKGIQNINGRGRGDQYVTSVVKNLSENAEKAAA